MRYRLRINCSTPIVTNFVDIDIQSDVPFMSFHVGDFLNGSCFIIPLNPRFLSPHDNEIANTAFRIDNVIHNIDFNKSDNLLSVHTVSLMVSPIIL